MQIDWRLARRTRDRPRLLLVESDLGRRATLGVALGTRYAVRSAATADDVLACAASTPFALAVLCERFRLATDLTVDEYVTCVRVAIAEQLLRDTNLGIDELAELLGFGDVHELARAFAALSPA